MALGGYPEVTGKNGEIWFQKDEEEFGKQFRGRFKNKFVVVWALNGSSYHKKYPLMEPVMRDWLAEHPDGLLVTVGDARAIPMEFNHPQVIQMCDQQSLLYVLALCKYANLVVGPESVVINAAGCWNVPKIPILSHSTHENLCKYFVNDYCLAPDPDISPCYPCHQLHYSEEGCPRGAICRIGETVPYAEGPICTVRAISYERMYNRLNEVYVKHGPK